MSVNAGPGHVATVFLRPETVGHFDKKHVCLYSDVIVGGVH